MTRAGDRDRTLCRNYCAYYKPGKNETMMCQGFVVVHGILRSGKKLSLSRPRSAAAPDARTREALQSRVCAVCSFRRSDCDFILTGGAAVPCGGIALLFQLLESGDVSLAEIEDAT